MAAVVRHRYDLDPHRTVEVDALPVPEPADGEVVVQVSAAGLDRGQWHLMAGRPYLMRVMGFGIRRPKEPQLGLDVAGTVVAVGGEVTGFAVGDEVFGLGHGTFAAYARVPVAKLAHAPAGVSATQAAALPVSGLTALQAVRDRAKVQPGQRVLVMGASGGVGSYVVQIAKAFGAEVTGVASGSKVDLVRALGADHVVDHTTTDALDGSVRYDAVIDTGGHRRLRDLRRALTRSGRLVIVGSETGAKVLGGMQRQLLATLWSPFVSQTMGTFLSSENAADLDALRDLVESGAVVPAVERTYALDEVADAMAALAAGRVRGKVVIEP
ncbi:NAD(P)-dependent alcohol dehydrogenase [Rhabdothermincola salaria]|uniref:NAD(P)-dependent alcohol dehydrogenase n=1 Tax=Rhabdothermincola salaria TaxID=2903142 RepID=UPI003D2DB6EC